jgi:hypothetical protein
LLKLRCKIQHGRKLKSELMQLGRIQGRVNPEGGGLLLKEEHPCVGKDHALPEREYLLELRG